MARCSRAGRFITYIRQKIRNSCHALASLLPHHSCRAVHLGVPEGLDAYTKLRYTDARTELADPAEQGDLEAMAIMGEMLKRGQGGKRDELRARDYIQKAQAGGSVRASYTLGQMYLTGNLVNRDEAKGVAMVKQAAELRYAPAQNSLGAWISNGTFGMEKNEATALA